MKVIWVDAHLDHAVPPFSSSKNFHGKPVAALSGFLDNPTSFNFLKHNLNFKNIVWIGLRHLDKDEKECI